MMMMNKSNMRNVAVMTLFFCLLQNSHAKGKQAKINCGEEIMTVTLPLEDGERAYLDQLKGSTMEQNINRVRKQWVSKNPMFKGKPEIALNDFDTGVELFDKNQDLFQYHRVCYETCAPQIEHNLATFKLDLNDVHKCGVTRILHQATGKRVFYHKVVVEGGNSEREVVSVRCSLGPPRQKRELDLPAGFQEPESLEITTSVTGTAPEPKLGVAVSQDGKKVSGEISVRPGTPLAMKVYLDPASAPIYGLMVSHLQVSDTASQQETIVFNGCSVDPYLFDNFVTTDGDSLEARFRAFKFPDTTYVQFRGTVQVCLDKCQGAQCNNGAIGYGRRRRSINHQHKNNKLFEISLTTFIKVEDDSNEADDVSKLLKNLKIANQMLDEHLPPHENSEETMSATVRERTNVYTTASSASTMLQCGSLFTNWMALLLTISLRIFA